MEIKLQIFGSIYSICFGYKTAWFESDYLITVTREWYDESKQVCHAEMLYRIYRGIALTRNKIWKQ